MSAETTTNEHARTDARTADVSHDKVTLLNALEEGDEILYRAGSSRGTTNPVNALEVTYSGPRTGVRTAAEHADATGEWDYDRDNSFTTHDCAHCAGRGHDGRVSRNEPNVTKLNKAFDRDEWMVEIEGPRGGEYKLVENNGNVYHSALSHDGLGGTVRWLSLERRDGDEDAAQDAFDAAINTDDATTEQGRPIVFQDRAGLGPMTEGLLYRVHINDADEFVVEPTTESEDLHIYTKDDVTHRGGRSIHYFFEDNYEAFVESGLKDDVFTKGGSLDWDRAHQQCHKDRNWEWSIDRTELAYVLEHLAERGHAITVPKDIARAFRNDQFRADNPNGGVPGLDETGEPIDAVDFREADADDGDDDEPAEADASAVESDADADEGDSVEAMGHRLCDSETVEETMENEREGFDLLTDEGGVCYTDLVRMADQHGKDPVEMAESLRPFGLFPVDAEGNELDTDALRALLA